MVIWKSVQFQGQGWSGLGWVGFGQVIGMSAPESVPVPGVVAIATAMASARPPWPLGLIWPDVWNQLV